MSPFLPCFESLELALCRAGAISFSDYFKGSPVHRWVARLMLQKYRLCLPVADLPNSKLLQQKLRNGPWNV